MYETKLSRSMRGDLEALTVVPLGFDDRVLRITTRKMHSGGIGTSAMVVTDTGDGCYEWAMCTDFSRRLDWLKVRATEKAIRDLHHKCLAQVHGIEAEARAHYAPKVPA